MITGESVDELIFGHRHPARPAPRTAHHPAVLLFGGGVSPTHVFGSTQATPRRVLTMAARIVRRRIEPTNRQRAARKPDPTRTRASAPNPDRHQLGWNIRGGRAAAFALMGVGGSVEAVTSEAIRSFQL